MKVIGSKLREIGMMVTLLSMVHMVSCEDRLDRPRPSVSEGEQVEVSLCVGLADEEEGAGLESAPVDTKSAGGTGLDVRLVSTKTTKAVTLPNDPLSTAKPDKLYGLEVWQYDGNGNCLNTNSGVIGDKGIGESFPFTLSAQDECLLVIIARGYNGSAYTVGTLKDKSLSGVQGMEVSASTIENITSEAYATNKSVINSMPYILHLPKVRVVNDGSTYKIQSPDGTDVRVLLRRMATRLMLAWENQYASQYYKMSQILLQSIPFGYKLIPTPDNNGSYPSLQDKYRTIQLPESSIKDAGSYSCWIPTVVRGNNSNATSSYYRTKENAPKGSAYATFVTQNTKNGKQKLSYRVYLGGTSSQNFDLKENTNYTYKVTMSHTSLPVNDKRITIIDPILASENNNNFVPTANCFMVVPGGAFCFNPYKYHVNGATVENTVMQAADWCNVSGGTINTPIKSVKVLWQTLEYGDLGDPVLGIVNTYVPGKPEDDQTNIVDLKNGTSLDNARIYCRVAPNTRGGSGVIAAYDGDNGTGNILWSWHIWVTDYNPDITGNTSVFTPANKRKQKYTYRCDDQYPMMDRNLGANAGYTEVPDTEEERSSANGFHYQWGRKDPFPSSYSDVAKNVIIVSGTEPTLGMLNLYKPDGFSFYQRSYSTSGSKNYSVAYKDPTRFHSNWNSFSGARWQSELSQKNEHDPCPVGWRVASYKNFKSFFTQDGYEESTGQKDNISINIKNGASVLNDGGAVLYYEGNGNGNTTYFRFNGYQRFETQFMYIGWMTNIWCREIDATNTAQAYAFSVNYGGYPFDRPTGSSANNIRKTWNQTDAHSVRCIQERAN